MAEERLFVVERHIRNLRPSQPKVQVEELEGRSRAGVLVQGLIRSLSICISVYVRVFLAHIKIYMYTYMYRYTCIYIYTQMHAYMYVAVSSMYTHTYTYVCIYIYIHVCVHSMCAIRQSDLGEKCTKGRKRGR